MKVEQRMPSDEVEVIYERRFRFEISGQNKNVNITFTNLIDKVDRYSQSNLPLWFQRTSKTEIPKMNLKRKVAFQDNI